MFTRKASKEIVRQGFVPGLIATLCCLGPLLLIMLGLVSASSALALTAYAPYFIPVGLIVLTISLVYALRKRRAMICHGCEDTKQERIRIIGFVIVSFIFAALTYVAIYYLLLPAVAPMIINNFGGK